MSLSTNVADLATRVATEAKALRTLINGNTADLSALSTTAKSSLVAAINELYAATSGAAGINDATTTTTTTWSSSKTNTQINAAVSALVAAAPGTLDTLNELAAALGDDPAFATTITTALSKRVQFDAAQALTTAEKTQARTNIGAGTGNSNLAIGTAAGTAADAAAVGSTTTNFVTTFEAGLV
jgi:hypothetical protein